MEGNGVFRSYINACHLNSLRHYMHHDIVHSNTSSVRHMVAYHLESSVNALINQSLQYPPGQLDSTRTYFQADTSTTVLRTSKVEGCGVSPMLVPAVDVLGCDQLLHAVQVPLLCSIQEGRVSPKEVSDVTVWLFHHVQRDQVITVATVYISTMLCVHTCAGVHMCMCVYMCCVCVCVCVCVCMGRKGGTNRVIRSHVLNK